MAKKITDKVAKAKPIDTNFNSMLSELAKQHNTLKPDSAFFGEEETGAAVRTWIPTGSIGLDTIISNKEVGGWPCGRIVELYGEEAYGKTSICFQGMANCQKMDGLVIFYDAEKAASEELMQGYGIDIPKVLYSNLDLVEDIFDSLEKNLTLIANSSDFKDKPIFVCVDSLASLKSKKLVEGSYEYNMNTQGEFAKLYGNALKRIVPSLQRANACLVVINQMRDKIGTFMSDPKTTPGGNAMKFYASVRLRLLGKKLIEIDEQVTKGKVSIGAHVTVRTDKCKLGPPKRAVDFQLLFTEGIYEYDEWITYLENLEYVKRGGSWYTFSETFPIKSVVGTKFQKNTFEEVLEDAEVHDKIKEIIIKAFIRPTNDVQLKEEQAKANAITE